MRYWVKLSEELTHGDGLRVDRSVNDLLLLIQSFLIQESQNLSHDMENLSLACERLSHKHETIQQIEKYSMTVFDFRF